MKYYPMFDLFDDFFTGNTTSDVMKTDIVENDCSVDYLLGRTDNPEVNSSSGEEQLHTIKIAARSGNFREITVTDSELEEMKKQIEAMEDVEDDI